MPNKIKILLFAMAAMAGLIVASVFINVRGVSGLGANISQIISGQSDSLDASGTSPDKNKIIKSDIDQDGLPDIEEVLYRTDPLNKDTDGDGFLDGEEINSGHDPLIPGPNDLLSAFNPNITQKLATLAISGLYEGSLKPENPKFDESVDTLVSAVLDDAISELKIEIDYKKLSFSDSSRSNQEKYIKEISPIYKHFLTAFAIEMSELEKNLSRVGESGFTNQNIINYYENKALEFSEIFNKLLTVNIPENWETNHLNLLQTAAQLSKINGYIAGGEKDPIKALIGLNRLIEFLDIVPVITDSYLKEIKNNNLNVKSTIFAK